ncbi:cysteine and glycine-rich protein 1-like [Oscarella lobularis]|uniref:cysteine and glycine-rich protein 1-like n=1 Tax=Oscarella lobularis TaxID=121494 RepID=UPI0033131C79
MSFGGAPKCPVCNKSVYANEEVAHEQKKYHKACFRCSKCGKGLDSLNVCNRDDKLFCKRCYGQEYGIGGYGFGMGAGVLGTDGGKGSAASATTKGSATARGGGGASGPSFGGGVKCGRCNKSVYTAEEVKGAGQSWHKRCFTCQNCNKSLDSTTVADKNGNIYCKGCYAKEFGPKGVGFGIGAGTLTT